jgi:Domain of unknown function (DUF4399)
MMTKSALFVLVALLSTIASSPAQETKSPPGAKVYFINLKNGDTVTNPVLIQFGLSGMGVAPAGLQGDQTAGTGHHHLLIDTQLKGDELKEPVPMDDTHRHFGKGQTEATITLPAGQHTLQLVLADWTHIPHVPPVMSERITITVK